MLKFMNSNYDNNTKCVNGKNTFFGKNQDMTILIEKERKRDQKMDTEIS